MWIWQQETWPAFYWDQAKLQPLLERAYAVHRAFQKKISWLHADFAQEAQALIFTEEAIQTSAIEGEILERPSVRSSVARHLGISCEQNIKDQQVEGLVNLLMDASQYQIPLSHQRLFSWHTSLFPTTSNLLKIHVGAYRLEKMYVMSGHYHKQIVHFEAPPPEIVHLMMNQFIEWFNQSLHNTEHLLRAGIAHLYFVTIHPFDDGNGRIARALMDLALAQLDQSNKRFYRLSSEIEQHRKNYYHILEFTQKGTLNITNYLTWFLETLIASVHQSENIIEKIIFKAKFWQKSYLTELNTRQKKALNLLLDQGDEFIGNMNTRKYAHLNKVSRATAYRELNDLCQKECLIMTSKGRSTGYQLIKSSII